MRIIPLVFLLFFSTRIWAIELKDTTLVNGCQLINWAGEKFKVFPGSFCQFFDDGSDVDESLPIISSNKTCGYKIIMAEHPFAFLDEHYSFCYEFYRFESFALAGIVFLWNYIFRISIVVYTSIFNKGLYNVY